MTVIRLLIALVLTVVLAQQAQRYKQLVWRHRAMLLGAVAFGLLALLNLLGLVAFDIQSLSMIVIALTSLLILGSVVMLFLSWRAGEMRSQRATIQQVLADERKRREESERR